MESLLRDNPGIRTVWTPGEQTRVTQSNYNQAVRHQSIIGLRQAKFLGRADTGGAGEVDLLLQQLAVQNEVSSAPSAAINTGGHTIGARFIANE